MPHRILLLYTTSMKKFQASCSIDAYLEAFHPPKTRIVQMIVETSITGMLVNDDFFIHFVTVAYKTNDILMIIFEKSFKLRQKLNMSLMILFIPPLYNNAGTCISMINFSFIKLPKSYFSNAIAITEVLCAHLYGFK
ncbi:hypothetical protein HanRHA438_Chr11g0527811 [Helianthus annuus]|nr:hypothetical protein HanRHA438_Chr11g0527811 [Helianthus annuus]